jgi:ubiquinone/menaquinone biosynthesis C-methylase UbiE/thiol-disulfide isomerase/thioredoxin
MRTRPYHGVRALAAGLILLGSSSLGIVAEARAGSGLGGLPQDRRPVRPDLDENDRWRDGNFDMDAVLDALDIRPGMIVGDLGAGWGYMTFKLARRVAPEGSVLAEDIETRWLDLLKARAAERGLSNIETVLGTASDPLFPAGRLDMIFMHAVLQWVSDRPGFIRRAAEGLKEDGRLVIIESESDGPLPDDGVAGPGRHPTHPGYLEIFRRAGLVVVSDEARRTNDPSSFSDHYRIFVLKRAPAPDKDLEFTLRREALDRSGLPITPIQGTLDFKDAAPPGNLKVPASLVPVGYAEISLSETVKLPFLRGTDASGAYVYVLDRNGDGDLANDTPLAFDKAGGSGTADVAIAYRDRFRGKPVSKTIELVLQEGRAGRIEYHFNELWRASLRNGAETLEVALQRWPIIFMDAKFDGSYDKVFFVEREVLGLGGKFFRLRPDFAGETLRLEEVDRKPVDAGFPAPDFEVSLWGSGERFRLSEHRGELVVLNFWSPLCVGSKGEAALYDGLAREFGTDPRIRFIAVVHDAEALTSFLKDRRHSFAHAVDPDLWSVYGVTAPFVTFVIDEGSRIVRRFFRFSPEIGADLRKLTEKR